MIFQHAAIIDGHIAGTWRTFRGSRDVTVTVTPLRRLTRDERRALADAGERYQRFLESPVELRLIEAPHCGLGRPQVVMGGSRRVVDGVASGFSRKAVAAVR